MPAENVVKKLGRVEYIEPNSLFTYNQDGKVQNGIPQPYEDYSFSVNLRVINGNRYDCGMTGDEGDISRNTIEFASDKGTISFMDGTNMPGQQGYLTTNFTDISMNDPGTNTKECLGIESISIKYDSWYFPSVDIKFVDVRGASLMQPSEYEYYNNGGPNLGNNKSSSNAEFFKAFFSFPYPLFKLSVKGFYGKEVTYDLSVLKCNAGFNSSTGNFEVSASFIGYMYGMYADLPFPFVFLAPYIDLYGKNTWDEKIKTGDFCYLTTGKEMDGSQAMYTFPELKRKVEDVSQKADKEIEESPDGKRRSDLTKLLNKLQENVLFNYPMSSKSMSWWSWSKTNTDDNRSGYFFLAAENSPQSNRLIFEDFYKFSKEVFEYNELVDSCENYSAKKISQKSIFEDLYKEAKSLLDSKTERNTTSTATTVSIDFTDEDINKLLSGKIVSLYFKKDNTAQNKPVLIYDPAASSLGSASQSGFQDLIDELKTRFEQKDAATPIHKSSAQKEWIIRAFTFDDINFKNVITETVNAMKGELNELTEKLDKERELTLEKALGFIPSMRNMFNMVFAHIDTFMSVFYNTLDRIRQSIQSDDDTRKYKKLCGDRVQVDVNSNTLENENGVSNGGKLPPFTMFYVEEAEKDSEDRKITMVWPGSLPGGENLDEVKLVESIVNATALNKKRYDTVTAKDNVVYKKGNLVPINYYDLLHTDRNPYMDVLNESSVMDSDIVNQILRIFLFRSYYSLLNGSYVGGTSDNSATSTENFTKKAKLIAELEIGNLERAFEKLQMKPNQNIIDGLLKVSNEGSSYIDKILTENDPLFVKNAAEGNLAYRGIKFNGTSFYCLPVGLFETAKLQNYISLAKTNLGTDEEKFLKISDDGTSVNRISCQLFSGGKKIDSIFNKYGTGDFVEAARLFPSYNKLPDVLDNVTFYPGTFNGNKDFSLNDFYQKGVGSYSLDSVVKMPSYRKTSAGITSIFMDPLYYAQKSPEARAYLFLLGIPYGKDKGFIMPESFENGDYSTLMLLREGAVYWRNDYLKYEHGEELPSSISDDPITYKYAINGIEYDTLEDIEANDPALGLKKVSDFYVNGPVPSEGRRQTLIYYFLKWANGVSTKRPGATTASTDVKIEVPTVSLDFQTIERNFGLWETVGTINRLLSPESCASAITAPYVNSFSNSNQLKDIYIIGADGKLGNLSNKKIRTEVFVKDVYKDATCSSDAIDFLNKFKKLYFGFDTIIDYATLDRPNKAYTVPRNAMNDAVSAFVSGIKDKLGISAEKLKENDGTSSNGEPENSFKKPEHFRDDDLKLACYMALKNMYDRWLCSRRRECWQFSCKPERMKNNGIKSDFLRFFYIDEFYHNIGMQVKPNLTKFITNACELGGLVGKGETENIAASSIIKMLSSTAQYGGCALLSLPTMLGLARTYCEENNSIADVFKAYPYNDAVRGDGIESSFVVLYSNQKSSILNIEDDKGRNAYKTDGFDIADTWGEIVPQVMFSDSGEDGFVVPSFGVTFAKQNQSYFKDVRMSMEDHQITEYSVRNEVMISYANNRGPRETTIIGQDLFSVYSNYSYSVSVTMLGDAQITPLMYFQLNNIPMWKGAYLITNVHHDITVRGMETVFTGVRQARPSVPFKNDGIDFPAYGEQGKTPQSEEETSTKMPEESLNISQRPLDFVNVDDVDSVVFRIKRMSLSDDVSFKWINGLLSVDIQYKDGTKDDSSYQNIAFTLEATTELGGKIENFTPKRDGVLRSLPAGRYGSVSLRNATTVEEYRNADDSFYRFTDGKHIIIGDTQLGFLKCEMVLGETEWPENGVGISSIGEIFPVMLYPYGADEASLRQTDKDEAKAIYREIFNFIKRMNDSKKCPTLLVEEADDIGNNKTDRPF